MYALPECLTCNDTIKVPYTDPNLNSVLVGEGTNCLYYSASFSQGGDYYALECLGDRIPITYIKSTNDKTVERMDRNINHFVFYHYLKHSQLELYLKMFSKRMSNSNSWLKLVFCHIRVTCAYFWTITLAHVKTRCF